MRKEQWENFKKAAKLQSLDRIPVGLIIDSPWMPGYLGISHLDYYLNPEVWFQGNLKIMEEFPEVIFVPSWWIEYGMAIEPSAMGVKILFSENNTPSEESLLQRLEDLDAYKPVDPYADGFMPLVLHLYKMQKQRIFDAGYTIPFVTARGPLCTASFVRGLTPLMMDFIEDEKGAHKLIEMATDTVISWLKAQAEVIGDSVEGIFILDDVVGFIGPEMYKEFAHPYLKKICDAFPENWIKVYHNDTASVNAILEGIAKTGFDVLNFSHEIDIVEAQERIGHRICLMGNINPLGMGVRGTPEEVKKAGLELLEKTEGKGVILSVGGGVSPGMPGENIHAMIQAVEEFSTR